MKWTNLLLGFGLATTVACGDNMGAGPGGSPDAHADDSDAAVPLRVDPCADQASGTACTWLGLPGEEGFTQDGQTRYRSRIYWVMSMLFASDGSVYFDDWNNHIIRRVKADGTIESVVGWTNPIFPGDGVPGMLALERTADGASGLDVQLNHPTDLLETSDGKILIMAWHNHKLREYDPETGKVRILAGGGAGFAGDGGPASAALFKQPRAFALDPAGNLYIADQQNQRVRMITDEGHGTITTIAGNGVRGFGGDEGPALDASLNWEVGSNPEPNGGLVWHDDKLYIADTLNNRIRVMDLESGDIDTLAGTGDEGDTGDGGPAAEATLAKPRDLAVGPDGDLYIADTDNNVIRAIDLATLEIRRVAGTGEIGLNGEGLSPLDTMLKRPFGIEFDPDGTLFIMDSLNSRVLKVLQ